MSSSPAVSLNQVSRELGIGVEHLRRSRARWLQYGQSGDPSDLLKVRVQRIDAHPKEWRDWVRNVGWLHSEVTRESESTYDCMRNPLTHSDLAVYRFHWLETRLAEAVEKISALGVLHFNPAFVYEDTRRAGGSFAMSYKCIVGEKHFSVKAPRRNTCLCRYHLA